MKFINLPKVLVIFIPNINNQKASINQLKESEIQIPGWLFNHIQKENTAFIYLLDESKLMIDPLLKPHWIFAVGTLSMGQLRITELPSSAFDDCLSILRSSTVGNGQIE